MIDAFLLVYIQENQDPINILGSLVDFETGVILSSQEVFEEINQQTFTIKAGLVKDYDPTSKSKKFAKYISFWA